MLDGRYDPELHRVLTQPEVTSKDLPNDTAASRETAVVTVLLTLPLAAFAVLCLVMIT